MVECVECVVRCKANVCRNVHRRSKRERGGGRAEKRWDWNKVSSGKMKER